MKRYLLLTTMIGIILGSALYGAAAGGDGGTLAHAAAHSCGAHNCTEVRAHVSPSGAGASGKWKDATTPKRGWAFCSITDRGVDNLIQCEMCEREMIRYVHTMGHYGIQRLDVGCICAAYMEGVLDTPKAK
jgi:hypothetical protein